MVKKGLYTVISWLNVSLSSAWRRVEDALMLVNHSEKLFRTIERMWTEEKLDEASFRTLVQYSSEVITVMDVDGKVRYQSPSVERVLGYDSEELVGENAFDYIHPDDAGRISEIFSSFLDGSECLSAIEFRFCHKDGSWRYLEVVANNLLQDPAIGGIVVNSRDITERKQAENELRRNARLLDLTRDSILVRDFDGKISYWNRASEVLYGWAKLEAEGEIAHVLLNTRFPEPLEEIKRKVARYGYWEGELVHQRRDGTLVVVASNWTLQLDEQGVPIRILQTGNDITQRKRTEEALQQLEHRYQSIFENAIEGIFILSCDGLVVSANPALACMFGYNSTEDLLHSVSTIEDLCVDHETSGRLGELLECHDGASVFEVQCLRKDGGIVWISVNAQPMYDAEGHMVGVEGKVEDISNQKRVEQALRQSEKLYRTVVEQTAENIFLVDVENKRILECNAALSRSLGYTSDELKNMTLYDIVAHDRESVDENIRRILQKGRHFIGERQYWSKDGSGVDVEASVSVVSLDDRRAMCIVAHDITERKRAEEDLRESLSVLLALREAGQVLGSTLESEEIISRLLEIMQQILGLKTAIVSVPDEHGNLGIWRSVGLNNLRAKVRFTPEAEVARKTTFDNEEQQIFELTLPDDNLEPTVGVCLPLRARESIVGVLEAYGPPTLSESETVEILSTLTGQAATALENARLYGELENRERQLQELIGKLLRTQEEERRRVAYEVHDGLAQVAVAAHQHLQAFARRHPPTTENSRGDLDLVMQLVRRTVSDARTIIANLRPTTLDDLGLATTMLQEVEHLRDEGYEVEYVEDLGETRLPDTVEIALYRVGQEALTNMRKHALTRHVRLELRRRSYEVSLEVRDYGGGFDLEAAATGGGPGERVGLAGMRERIAMLGGKLEVNSKLGVGTSIVATIDLKES